MTTAITPFRRGRPSNSDLSDRLIEARDRVADLEVEVAALHAERAAIATEVEALSRRMQLAYHADRPDVALHVAGRLDAMAASLQRRGSEAA